MRKALSASVLASVVLLTLTACDPPIPDSVLVEIAERSYNCEEGNVTLAAPTLVTDVSYQWADLIATGCESALSLEPGAAPEGADIVIAREAYEPCSPFTTVPVAMDGAAVVFMNSEAFLLNLTAEAVQGIFSGTITNWSDPAIAEANPDLILSDLPIEVSPASPKAAISAMESWTAQIAGTGTTFSLLQPDESEQQDSIFELPEGGIALIALSEALYSGMTLANVVDADGNSVEPSLETLTFAATQFDFVKSETGVTANYDPEKEAIALAGQENAGAPYAAAFPLIMSLCGEDTLLKRAAGRFLVRQDSQGLLGASTLGFLSEEVRIASAAVVSQGLPTPEAVSEAE
jgi:phosphate transport system substrate-binding protein